MGELAPEKNWEHCIRLQLSAWNVGVYAKQAESMRYSKAPSLTHNVGYWNQRARNCQATACLNDSPASAICDPGVSVRRRNTNQRSQS
ncbi:hypothetical protein TOC8171_23690 [Pseudomonas syringae]